MDTITRKEDIVRRWKAARQQKKEATAWMVKELTDMYEEEFGKKPQSIEVW